MLEDVDDLLTLKEAAELSRISRDTLRRWIKSGALAHLRPTSRILVRRRDLLLLLEAGRPGPRSRRAATAEHRQEPAG